MFYLTVFKHFVPIFSLIFDPIDSIFIDLISFWPLFFTKPEIRLGLIVYHMLKPATENLVKYPRARAQQKAEIVLIKYSSIHISYNARAFK